jgi:EpsI family protein
VPLLKKGTLAEIVPATFKGWVSEDVGDPLAINGAGTLSAKLYSQLVTRVYTNPATGAQVMSLFAYGGKQTADLQLHRPEICYPAFGYALSQNQPTDVAIGSGVILPARQMFARQASHAEGVLYWSRVGEYLPVSSRDQRKARLEISLKGIIPDGVLSRFSVASEDPIHAWAEIKDFVPQLLSAIAPDQRSVLIGTARAHGLIGG